jgi:alkaline phosphatase D
MHSDRRKFLKSLGFFTLTPYSILLSQSKAARANDTEADLVFPLSVASGDPAPDGVVLWTRVNPAVVINRSEPLYFEVASDRSFTSVLYRGVIDGSELHEGRDYTVSVDLAQKPEAQLQPFTRYYYRFIYRDTSSRIGCCKTLPNADDELARLRFAQLTCQDYTSGYFAALDAVADEVDLDFVVHLGDFVYEYARYPDVKNLPRAIAIPQQAAVSLEDFRFIYREYRKDRSLQRAMENHTWIITTDDHETANDCYWDYAQDALGLPAGEHPLSAASTTEKNRLKLAAQRAWVEYVPARVELNPDATHPWDYLKIYRKFRFGRLGELYMTDTRTYRSVGSASVNAENNELLPAGMMPTMLGTEQKAWLIDGMRTSSAQWQIWGNQTLLGQFGVLERISGRNLTLLAGTDAWDGYPEERRDVLEALHSKVEGRLLVLTGDLHTYLTSYVKLDYNQASNSDRDNVIGIELMTPSITSSNFADSLRVRAEVAEENGAPQFIDRVYRFIGEQYIQGPLQETVLDSKIRLANPHFADFGAVYYGYTVVELKPETVEWRVYHVDRLKKTLAEAKRKKVRHQRYHFKDRKIQNIFWPFGSSSQG